ncbi:hypothetical protein M514_06762, partial [Trichuris suis]
CPPAILSKFQLANGPASFNATQCRNVCHVGQATRILLMKLTTLHATIAKATHTMKSGRTLRPVRVLQVHVSHAALEKRDVTSSI